MKTKGLERDYERLMFRLGERCKHVLTPAESEAFVRYMYLCAHANEAGLTPPSPGESLVQVFAKLVEDPEASVLVDRINAVTDTLRKRKMS